MKPQLFLSQPNSKAVASKRGLLSVSQGNFFLFVCLILDLQGHICMLKRKNPLALLCECSWIQVQPAHYWLPFSYSTCPQRGKRIDFTVFSTDKDWVLCSYHWKQNPIVIWLIGTLWSLILTILHLTFCVKYSWKSLYNKRTFSR